MRKKVGLILAAGAAALAGATFALTPTAMTASSAPDTFRFSSPSGWSEARSYKGMRTWTGDRSRRQFISVVEDPDVHADAPPTSDRELAEVFKKGAAIPHWIAGIKNYEILKLERQPLKGGGLRVAVVGTYDEYNGEQVRFEEWKYFLPSGYSQINYSELSDSAPMDRESIQRILRRYEPFGS